MARRTLISLFLRLAAVLFIATGAVHARATELDGGADGGPPTTTASTTKPSSAIVAIQIESAKRDYEAARAEIAAIDRELAINMPVPNPKIDTATVAKALHELQIQVAKSQQTPPPTGPGPNPPGTGPGPGDRKGAVDCAAADNALIDALQPATQLWSYAPWGYETSVASSASVQAARNRFMAPDDAVLDGRTALQQLAYNRSSCAGLTSWLDTLTQKGLSKGGSLALDREPATAQALASFFENERTLVLARVTAYREALNTQKAQSSNAAAAALHTIEVATENAKTETAVEKKSADVNIIKIALFAMPLFVVVLFVGSAFFKRRAQEKLFAQRTVIELVGLALLLMTIIILGTNDKVDVHAMGALLGSIAGYVFGQQAQRLLNASESNKGVTNGNSTSTTGGSTGGPGPGGGSPPEPPPPQGAPGSVAAAATMTAGAPAPVGGASATSAAPPSAQHSHHAPRATSLQMLERKLYTAAIAALVVIGGVLAFAASDLSSGKENDIKLWMMAVLTLFFLGGIFGVNAAAVARDRSSSQRRWTVLGVVTAAIIILLAFAIREYHREEKEQLVIGAKMLSALIAVSLFGVAAALGTSLWRRVHAELKAEEEEKKTAQQQAQVQPSPATPGTP